MDIVLDIDLGPDRGQGFGTLFEATDASGRAVCGAGFADVYNSLYRSDRFTLQFYVRHPRETAGFTLNPLPRSTTDRGVYAFDFDGRLHAKSASGPVHPHGWFAVDRDPRDADNCRAVRAWDDANGSWGNDADLAASRMRVGDGKMRVAGRLLRFQNSRAEWGGQVILETPTEGFYHHFYYAIGHLVFFHKTGKSIRLLACPWEPGSERPADVAGAVTLQLEHDREFPFAMGQWNGEVIVSTNLGGSYGFDGTQWRVLRKQGSEGRDESYQLYSTLPYEDRLLLAHYPSGHLWEHDGASGRELHGWPPRPDGAAAEAREAQTTMIYAGDLWVGVWPWAELWRYDRAEQAWEPAGRLFDEPALTDDLNHPYEENGSDPAARNHWGQRITSLVPVGGSLMAATSAKFTWPEEARPDFISDTSWEQYGRILQIRVPGCLSAPVRWNEGNARLRFRAEEGRMSIEQDGVELDSTAISGEAESGLRDAGVRCGEGVFGRFGGASIGFGR
jgi:hypothetical protein